ncbi:M48 family metalloprotease [Iodobacter sp. LRB]|uniref:M48 family metalloprotease n=1 Tax=unclassified Iodobacter TaxID=235634 RepID=UPI000C0C9A01|nr:M48 family metalloprotease [Iodobacter sp. BJB302]PHU99826.1 peptidase M48 [Iodobacter sp. BJB302]
MRIRLTILACLLPAAAFAFDFGKLDISNLIEGVKNTADAMHKATPAEEEAIGASAASLLLGAAPLVANTALQHYVNQVGMWIVKQSEQPDRVFHFGVIDSPNINAFTTPGGYILLTRGLFDAFRNEAELAGVLAHEITHTLKRHHMQAIESGKWQKVGSNIAKAGADNVKNSTASQLVSLGSKNALELFVRGLDKGDEYEADIGGMVLAARAGYNPYGLVSVLQTLGSINPQEGTVALMFSTHPSPSDRLNTIEEVIGDKLENYAGGAESTKRFQAIKASLGAAKK